MNAQSTIEAATLASAMALAFGEIEAATKGKENAAFKAGGKVSKYADITAIIEAVKPALINHGLFFTQHPKPSENGVTVETVLHHANGEHYSLGELFVPANKHDAQGFGSALTYARRYALVTAFGVPVEDDDGNAAARGSSKESAFSPSPLKQQLVQSVAEGEYPFPAGPATGITQLKSICRNLWREVEGCGDDDTLDLLLDLAENKAVIAQLKALEHPAHRQIWEGDGKDNPGLSGLINRKRAEFQQLAPNIFQAG